MDPSICTTEKVAVYQAGIYSYLLVTDEQGIATLYNQDGQFYCQNSSNYDCVSAYNLGAPIDSWECGTNGGCNCPAVVQPVCGVDNITYNNACEAACVGVEVAFSGMCNIDPAAQCFTTCLLYTSPSPRDATLSRMPSSA